MNLPDFITDDFDGELILSFLTEFELFEQALVRAGFVQVGSACRNAQPDWMGYARHIAPRFRPDSSVEVQGAISYLLLDPTNRKLREERLESAMPGDLNNAANDLFWLVELVQETGRKLTYGIHFPEKSDMDTTYVTAAWFVLSVLSAYDPTVDSLLMRVQ